MPYYEDIVFLSDIPRYHATHNPDQTAFVYEDKETSYKDFNIRTMNVIATKSNNKNKILKVKRLS